MAGEVMDHRGESTTAIVPDQYNPQLNSKHLPLGPQVTVALTPYQRSFFLQQIETITDIHNWSNAKDK